MARPEYYAVWKEGLEWPELFRDCNTAKKRCDLMAKQSVGERVVLLHMKMIGSTIYPYEPQNTGEMSVPASLASPIRT